MKKTRLKAGKRHQCEVCLNPINRGEEHIKLTFYPKDPECIDCETPLESRLHLECDRHLVPYAKNKNLFDNVIPYDEARARDFTNFVKFCTRTLARARMIAKRQVHPKKDEVIYLNRVLDNILNDDDRFREAWQRYLIEGRA